MGNFFRILLVGLGLPAIAQQIRHQGQMVSDKLAVVTFLTERHREITKIAIFAFVGTMLTISGVSMGILATALYFDLHPAQFLSFSTISSFVILVAGLICGAYAWRKILKMEKDFQVHQEFSQHKTSLTKTILTSVLNAVVGGDAMKLWDSHKSIN